MINDQWINVIFLPSFSKTHVCSEMGIVLAVWLLSIQEDLFDSQTHWASCHCGNPVLASTASWRVSSRPQDVEGQWQRATCGTVRDEYSYAAFWRSCHCHVVCLKKMMVNECVTPPGARALNIEQVSFAQLLHGPRLFIRVMLPWYWKTEIGDRSNCQTVKQWLRPSDTQTAKERQTDKLSQTEGLIIYMTGYKQNMKITIP